MRKALFAILLFSTISVLANNNNEAKKVKTTSISGKVVDQTESLTGVKVMIDDKETVVYTDFDGNFTINDVPVGTHKVSFSMVAYENKEIIVDLSEEKTLEVSLSAR